MPIPSITNQEVNGLLRATPASSSLVCVMGCSSAGTANQLYVGARLTDLVTAYGYGPGVELAGVKAAAAKQFAFIKLPTVTAGAAGAVTDVGTGTSVTTVTGAAYDAWKVRAVITAGGTIGVAGIKLKYSLNDGLEYSLEYAIGTATSFVIPNTGLTLAFAAGTHVLNDTYTFSTTAPQPDVAGINAAMEVLRTASLPVDSVQAAGDATSALLLSLIHI
jgi:hypothetical protein